ncbi:unnamed protein product [Gongylonema pulchrum]|uniref:COesterase domain-containing protein n=1 Tax=Gongylonema pulchrum TaxID=637853 RepID=A0A183D2J3_9BILA|nr:unnamed protein product [Gongylonema pulchrum]
MNIILHFITLIALLLKPVLNQLVTLHDGSPLYGRETYGANGKLVTEFLGIPFAEPPVGQLRFRKPKPKQPWRTPFNATKMPKACIQVEDSASPLRQSISLQFVYLF